jgi:hypothetical protein
METEKKQIKLYQLELIEEEPSMKKKYVSVIGVENPQVMISTQAKQACIHTDAELHYIRPFLHRLNIAIRLKKV